MSPTSFIFVHSFIHSSSIEIKRLAPWSNVVFKWKECWVSPLETNLMIIKPKRIIKNKCIAAKSLKLFFFLSKEWSWTNSWCSHRSSYRVRRDSTGSRNLDHAYLHSFSCCSQFPRKSFPQKNGSSSIWRRDAICGSMKWRQLTRFPFNLLHSFLLKAIRR